MHFPDQESGEETKPFVKLKDKESVKIVFRGEPLVFHTHWVGATTTICPGREICELCRSGQKNNFRFRLNAVVNENGQYVAKVFENGWKLYEQLREMNKEVPLEKNVWKITRTGSTKNDTSYFPIPLGPITQETQLAASKVPLIDLSPYPPAASLESPKMELGERPSGATSALPRIPTPAQLGFQNQSTGLPPHAAANMGPPDHAFTEDDIPF